MQPEETYLMQELNHLRDRLLSQTIYNACPKFTLKIFIFLVVMQYDHLIPQKY